VDTYLTTMQILGLAIGGMCHSLLGSIKVPLANKLNIKEDKVGALVSAFGFTMIPMAFAAGIMADEIGRDLVLGIALGIMICSVLVLANAKTYTAAVIAVLLLGTGWSALVNVLNALQGAAFLPFFDENTPLSSAMNLGDFVFGAGAFVMPIATAFLLAKVGLKKTFSWFAVLMAIALVFVFFVNWESLKPDTTKVIDDWLRVLLTDSVVLICCIAFFFHVPTEACVALWATTLMKDRGVTDGKASTLLSVFWLVFTVSRLVAALLMPAGMDHTILIALAITCTTATVGLALSRSKQITVGWIILLGAIMGPIFPILIAQLVDHVGTKIDAQLIGRAIGLFFCIGGIGWALMPLIAGKVAAKTSIQKAFFLISAGAACLTALTIILSKQPL
jgi:fucose permease